MSNESEANLKKTIERLKELAGINPIANANHPKIIVLVPEDTDVVRMKNLVGKLKEIEDNVGEIWTDFDIGDIKKRATGITHD